MPVQECLQVIENVRIKEDVFRLVLSGQRHFFLKSGQFVNVKVPGKALRRPISVTSYTDHTVTLTYRIAGEGTKLLTQCTDTVNVINECGNGFSYDLFEKDILLIGGGIGTAPLVACAEEAVRRGLKIHAVFGFRDRSQTLFEEEMKALGADLHYVYDEDGENTVTKVRELGWQDMKFLCCGPTVMMRAVDQLMTAEGEFSLETRMGCGFGGCMGCSLKLKSGMARICKEGPVFRKGEILWENLL